MTVLTIDFDIIMKPSINFYNDAISDDNPVSKMIEDNPCVEMGLQADLSRYQYLTRIVLEAIQRNIPITFIKDHHKMLTYVALENKEPVDVINIDHHHDIGYDIENWDKPIANGQSECGNWVKYGKDRKLINNYTWIKNENSDDVADKGKEKYLTSEIDFTDFTNQPLPAFGRLFICASFEWIPPMYRPLYDMWITMYEELTGQTVSIDKY